MDDSISYIACARRPRRDRRVGDTRMNADVFRFIPRPTPGRGPTDFPTIAFRAAAHPDEYADTAPSEYVAPDSDDPA